MDEQYFAKLKEFNAKRKFKGGMIAVQAITSTLLSKGREKK